jgi:vancomycin resistance protein VanJ
MTNQSIQPSSPLSFMRRVFTSTFVALSGAYGLSLSGFLLVRLLIGEATTVIAFLSTFLHLLMLPALALFPISLILRRPRLALTQAAPVAVFIASYGISFIPRSFSPPAGATRISLLTYNIHAEENCLEPMLGVIREANADVVTLQELSLGAAVCFERDLADLYPYRALHPRENGTQGQGILSRFPISEDEYWRNEQFRYALGHQRVQLDVLGRTVTLYNAHPLHPGMMGKFFDNSGRRAEIDVILDRAARDTTPVLIAGDFNMTDQTVDYLHIIGQYGDTYREVGWGMGFTFPDLSKPEALPSYIPRTLPIPPIMRLDYVFHSAHFAAVEARVWPSSGGSDHYPVYAVLGLKPN